MHLSDHHTFRNVYIFFFVMTVVLVCVTRFAALSIPLERDEGEYAYSGQLLLDGIAPFTQSYNMKFPGVYIIYAILMKLFGQTIVGIHLGAFLCMLISSVGIFMLSRQLFDKPGSSIASIGYAIFSFSPTILGFTANTEHFVNLFVIWGGVFLLWATIGNKRVHTTYIISGFLFGTAVLMKQHAATFALFGFIYSVTIFFLNGKSDIRKRLIPLLLYCLGLFLPFIIMCLWLVYAQAFSRFWFWTFVYARSYISQVPIMVGVQLFSNVFRKIITTQSLLWIMACIGLFYCKNVPLKKRIFLGGWFISSFVALLPGLLFRPHYFIMIMPVVAVAAGLGTEMIASLLVKKNEKMEFLYLIATAVIICLTLSAYLIEQKMYFIFSPDKISRYMYGFNPFPESCVIADSIKSWTNPEDKIGIIGSEPQICFYAHRKSATGYLYVYALMEVHPFAQKMQREMIEEIEKNQPSHIVFVNVATSWLTKKNSSKMIFKWFDTYWQKKYYCKGIVDITSVKQTVYRWNEEIVNYKPKSSCWCAIFQRYSSNRITNRSSINQGPVP